MWVFFDEIHERGSELFVLSQLWDHRCQTVDIAVQKDGNDGNNAVIDKVLNSCLDQAGVNTRAIGDFLHMVDSIYMWQKLLSCQIPFIRVEVVVLPWIHVHHQDWNIPIINIGWIRFSRDYWNLNKWACYQGIYKLDISTIYFQLFSKIFSAQN